MGVDAGKATTGAKVAGEEKGEKLHGRKRDQAQFKALLRKNFTVKTRGVMKWCTLIEVIIPAVFVAVLSMPRAILTDTAWNDTLYPEFTLATFRWSQKPPGGYAIWMAGDADSSTLDDMGKETFQRLVCGSEYTAREDEISLGPVDQEMVDDFFNQSIGVNALELDPDLTNFLLVDVSANLDRENEKLTAGTTGDLYNAMHLLDNYPKACSDPLSDLWDPLFNGNVSQEVQNRFPDKDFNGANRFVKTQQSLEDASQKALSEPAKVLAAIELSDLSGNQPSYTLRVNGTSFSESSGNWFDRNFAHKWDAVRPPLKYRAYYAFVNVQSALEQTIVSFKAKSDLVIDATIKEAPWLSYTFDLGTALAGVFTGLFLPIAFTASVILIIKSLVQEKELRLREGMQMMGMTDSMFWATMFIMHWGSLLCTSIIVSLMGIYTFPHSDFSVNLVFFIAWTLMLVFFSYVMSTFFDNSQLGSIVGAFVYLITITPAIVLTVQNPSGDPGWLGIVVLPAAALFQWGHLLARMEVSNIGVTWSSMDFNAAEDGSFEGAQIIGIVIATTFFYAVMAWYLDKVYPSRYGSKYKPWFMFQKDFWFPSAPSSRVTQESLPPVNKDDHEGVIEQTLEKTSPSGGIFVRDLCKVFGNGVKAVDNFSADFYEGEISGLLGHNGAGKTTTFSMLAGAIAKTSGTALIDGKNISNDIKRIREDLGVCPQFDTLWPTLTVREHLRLYASFAGVPERLTPDEVVKRAKEVNLGDKLDELASNLSGGQRRKLSLAIAFIGSPKIIFLDEPTSAMDPSARQFAWDVIRKEREGATILLTTHYMDEADALCDRIAIMSAGKTAACGSSVFLKNRFGVGYHLMIDKQSESTPSKEIVNVVQNLIPQAAIASNIGSETSITLPRETTSLFSTLLSELERSKGDLGIRSYGISCTTLEEVFLSIAERASRKKAQENDGIHAAANSVAKGEDEEQGSSSYGFQLMASRSYKLFLGGKRLWWRQFASVVRKRVRILVRDWVSLLFKLLVPTLFLVVALGVSEVESPAKSKFNSLAVARSNLIDNIQPALAFSPDADQTTKDTVNNFLPAKTGGGVGTRSPGNEQGTILDTCDCFCPTSGQTSTRTHPVIVPFDRKCLFEASNASERACVHSENGFDVYKDGQLEDTSGSEVACTSGFSQSLDEFLLSAQEEFTPCNKESDGICDALYIKKYDPGIIYQHTVVPNPSAFHAVSVDINELSTVVIRSELGNSSASILGTNDPLPREGTNAEHENTEVRLMVALFITLAGAILSASFSSHVAQEKGSIAKHLQMVSGLSKSAYWIANLCVDLLVYLLPLGAFMIVFAAFNSKLYETSDALEAVFVTLLLFGFASIPLAYLLHFGFTDEMNNFVGQLGSYFVLGFVFICIAVILESMGITHSGAQDAQNGLQYIFRFVPHYCLGKAMLDIGKNTLMSQGRSVGTSGVQDGADASNVFSMGVTGTHLAYLGAESVVFFAAVLIYEYYGSSLVKLLSPSKDVKVERTGEDEDVVAEKERVKKLGTKSTNTQDNLIMKDMELVYNNGFAAVKGITAGCEKGRVFGLLGVNGAGKTTTFKMITGELSPTSGDAFVRTRDNSMASVTTDLERARQVLGYCPQYDAIQGIMTPRELLKYYAEIRGAPRHMIDDIVSKLIDKMQLSQFADRLSGNLSGGNKRKLCVGIALTADPPCVLLDEPSTGVDPEARRFLWDVILDVLPGRVVVLTSHSMEECEALCHKLAIMVDGNFRCMGSVQHIKSKYGQGYHATFRLPPEDMGQLKERMQQLRDANKLSHAELVQEHGSVVTYHLLIDSSELATLFENVEKLRKELNINDYSVSQTTLEQVFVRFARDAGR